MKKHICLYSLLCAGLLAGLCFASCTDEDWGQHGNAQEGIALSPYKEKQVSRAMEPGDKYFKEGTKYRIWIMNQGGSTPEESTEEETGIVATETRRGDIPIIGIRPIEQTTPDFYGFTQNSQTDVPEDKAVTGTYPIELQPDGDYIDYLRGELKAPYEDSDYAQGDILQMPFKHIMSQVTFQVSKDTELDTDIQLVSVEMVGANTDNPTGITSAGTYQVYNNTFVFTSDAVRRIEGNNMDVPSADLGSDNVGEVATILVFPTFETVAEEQREIPLTYLRVTFKDSKNYYGISDNEGNRTVLVPIYNTITSVEGTTDALEFRQNYAYTLHIAFSSDIRRVVTLVPKVYEWIEGEGNEKNGYMQEQDMGQPVTFNGVLWSDRNLGATSGNPTRSVDDWYNSIGYVYQYGRNIPYFPYDYKNGVIDYTTPASEALGTNGRKVYPVIDYEAWGNNINRNLLGPNTDSGNLVWDLTSAQEDVGNKNFGYYNSENYRLTYLNGYNNEWAENKKTPCPPGWRLPTVRDFMGIMPSSGFSGNITFRRFTGISDNGSWQGDDQELQEDVFSADRIDEYTDTFWKKDDSSVYEGAFPYIYREETDDFLDGTNAKGVYILSMGEGDRRQVIDESPAPLREDFTFNWGVIYGIKNQGTRDAYRIRWHIELVNDESNSPTIRNGVEIYTQNPFHGLLVISRYEASENDNFNLERREDYGDVIKRYDWDHPVEVMYLPVGGYCDATTSHGALNNIGTEVWYATSELNTETVDKKRMIWIKYAGTAARNSQTIAVNDQSYLGAAVYVRCVRDLYNTGYR
ncbi:fimbrillin family protein [Bacteroides sp. An269]|uniref:fimbrillin family protein n=1 Tax=Bacteroides sp. An269 TaxID=1965613 RepID=UPI000B388EDF|nr:fimbrillin family protein [Bacteroides sp. An269]OUO73991.1 hypothetical protein B5F71_12180 [Bacteroides sp. An269]